MRWLLPRFKLSSNGLLSLTGLVLALISFSSDADAGLIVNRPLYIGLESGLVGYWSFDGSDIAGERAYDRSGNANTGLLTNSPRRVAGRVGQALEFDGSDDQVDTGSSNSLDDVRPVTISAWIKPDGPGESISAAFGDGFVVSKVVAGGDGYWTFNLWPTNAIGFQKNYTSANIKRVSSNNTITLGVWQHVVLTWDDSASAVNVHIYINGQEPTYQTSDNGVGIVRSDALIDLNIGNDDGGTSTFDGLIDEVRIYNRVLSADEIKRLYNMGR